MSDAPTQPDLVLSPDQQAAKDAILSWYESSFRAASFRLGGLAGTGKTTILSSITSALSGVGIAYCAYTGKAAHVLRTKLTLAGPDEDEVSFSITTIHGLIYLPMERETVVGHRSDGEPITKTKISWSKRDQLPGWIKLIVVDEASMIDEYVWADLLSYKRPILAVGDHFQLPPVRSSFSLMRDLDVRLERIHRQAEQSPIIQVARHARESFQVPFGWWSPVVAKLRRAEVDLGSVITPDTMLLVQYNRTRVAMNRAIRRMRGWTGDVPVVGDRVVCRRNNHEAGIFNGVTGIVTDVDTTAANLATDQIGLEVLLDYGGVYKGVALRRFFHSEGYERSRADPKAADTWDFGYALTVHCAQGSQAKRVVVIEENTPRRPTESHGRWMYTACTRATDELLIVA